MGDLSGKHILVTGAAGFVGANLVCRLLSEGVRVFAMVRPGSDLWRLKDIISRIRLMECDLQDFDAVNKTVSFSRPEIIFHSAFPGGHNPDVESQRNKLSIGLLGTHALLEAAKTFQVDQFIHLGSSTEYHPSNKPHHEDELIEPIILRGVSKAASTLLCQQYAHQYKMKMIILRLFTVYGPWEQENRLVPATCRAILQDETLPLTSIGVMHDWVYVDDVVDACLRAVLHPLASTEIINIGSGKQHSNEQIVQTLGEIAGKEVKVKIGEYPSRSFDTTCWVADISKAKKLLNWRPTHTLHRGLDGTFQFWKALHCARNRTPGIP